MNSCAPKSCGSRFPEFRSDGYTLVETMVATSVFSIAMLALLAGNLSGLRLNEFIRPKVDNARYARQTLSTIIEEVRCANSIQVGNVISNNFVAVGATNLQAGNALRIYTSTNTFIYYFAVPSSASLKKIPLSSSTAVTVASGVTNAVIFRMEDFGGRVLTNSQNNAVMEILLQLRRGASNPRYCDSYQVRARLTRRNIL